MSDVVVTLPLSFGLDAWIAEGDAAGDDYSGEEWGWFLGGHPPRIEPGEHVYVVHNGLLRGYAPLLRVQPTDRGYALVRGGRRGRRHAPGAHPRLPRAAVSLVAPRGRGAFPWVEEAMIGEIKIARTGYDPEHPERFHDPTLDQAQREREAPARRAGFAAGSVYSVEQDCPHHRQAGERIEQNALCRAWHEGYGEGVRHFRAMQRTGHPPRCPDCGTVPRTLRQRLADRGEPCDMSPADADLRAYCACPERPLRCAWKFIGASWKRWDPIKRGWRKPR